MDKTNKYILAVCPCGGKTFFRKNNSNIQMFEYPNRSIIECYSEDTDRKILVDAHNIIYRSLFKEQNETLLHLFPDTATLKLYNDGYPVVFFVPSKESFTDFQRREEERGLVADYTSETFESRYKRFWDLKEKDPKSVVYLKEGQYLSDVIEPYLSERDQYLFKSNRAESKVLSAWNALRGRFNRGE